MPTIIHPQRNQQSARTKFRLSGSGLLLPQSVSFSSCSIVFEFAVIHQRLQSLSLFDFLIASHLHTFITFHKFGKLLQSQGIDQRCLNACTLLLLSFHPDFACTSLHFHNFILVDALHFRSFLITLIPVSLLYNVVLVSFSASNSDFAFFIVHSQSILSHLSHCHRAASSTFAF